MNSEEAADGDNQTKTVKAPGPPVRTRKSRPSAGARNKATRAIEQLAEGHAESLGEKVMELALGGDVACLRMMLDRVCPIRKGRPINVDMPPIKCSRDLFAAIAAIWTAIGDGHLTPDEAAALCVVVDRSIQAIQLHDVVARIAALEEVRDKRDENNDTAPT